MTTPKKITPIFNSENDHPFVYRNVSDRIGFSMKRVFKAAHWSGLYGKILHNYVI